MKITIICLLLFVNVLSLFAQQPERPRTGQADYFSLFEDEVRYDDDQKIIYITTTLQPTQELGYKAYRIYIESDQKGGVYIVNPNPTPPSESKLNKLVEKLEKYTLYINQKPFTGFFRVASSFYDMDAIPYSYGGNYLSIYQYDKGKFEKVDQKGDVDLRTEQGVVRPAKPVLYLYPTQEQKINVQIHLTNHRFSHVYPAYENGWNVVAKPDGTLKNLKTNREHYCLFWETEGVEMMSKIEAGFMVTGKETEAFLEEKLATLGLSPKEINEFIIYWLPQMENNAYNAIYFAQSEYEAISNLDITPQPNTTIRVMMLWQKLEKPMQLKEQKLPETPVRTGFVAVEWGGAEVHNFQPAF